MTCGICGWPMTMKGGKVISPPKPDGSRLAVESFDVCTFCWTTSVQYLFPRKEKPLGVDAVLFVWGEKIPDEKLALINQGFHEVLGPKDLERKGEIVELVKWFDAVPGTVLYEVDTNGARWFHHEIKPETGWPSVKRRIELCQLHFPDHFIIYTNDLAYHEEENLSYRIVDEDMIRLNDAASDLFEKEFQRASKAD